MKIKVNLTEASYNKLIEDIRLFKISKSDKTINKNKFINLLFKNYNLIYEKNIDKTIQTINSLVDNIEMSKEIALKLQNDIIDSKNNYFNKSLTFLLNEENSYIFEEIENNLIYISASAYFRNMIMEYLSYPQYKREEIIYQDIVDKLLLAIEKKNIIHFKSKDNTVIFMPYKLSTSKEEVYSYLLGKTDKGSIMSYNISSIKNVVIKRDTFEFNSHEIEIFEENIKNGIQFPYSSPYRVTIRLTAKGVEIFEKRYVNRPIPISIEENRYTFSCSFYQLKSYFLAFGHDAYIEGKRLRDAINEEYQASLNMYDKKKNKEVL